MITAFFQGFGTGGSLIVAIGAQNAFVLSQGIRGKYHGIIALTCILCDVVFITAGVAGFGAAVAGNPSFSQWVTWGGALFLFVYGWRSLCSALTGASMESSDRAVRSLRAAVLSALAVSLLNPHFYLDTVFLMGGVSSRFYGESRLYFWAGAVSASTVWFISLSLGARVLAPIFQKQRAWRILDSLVCVIMWFIAVSLVRHGMSI